MSGLMQMLIQTFARACALCKLFVCLMSRNLILFDKGHCNSGDDSEIIMTKMDESGMDAKIDASNSKITPISPRLPHANVNSIIFKGMCILQTLLDV